MRRRDLAALLAVTAVTAAGCGADDEPSSTPTVRTESPPLPTATPTATETPGRAATPDEPTATARSAPAPPPDAGVDEGHGVEEDQEGGAGDEAPARTRVTFVVDGEGITPPSKPVPPFLGIRVTIRNDLPRRIRGTYTEGGETPTTGRFGVPARGRRAFSLPGLSRGRHTLEVVGAGQAAIVVTR